MAGHIHTCAVCGLPPTPSPSSTCARSSPGIMTTSISQCIIPYSCPSYVQTTAKIKRRQTEKKLVGASRGPGQLFFFPLLPPTDTRTSTWDLFSVAGSPASLHLLCGYDDVRCVRIEKEFHQRVSSLTLVPQDSNSVRCGYVTVPHTGTAWPCRCVGRDPC